MYPRLCVARKGAWKEEKGKERREREERKKKKKSKYPGPRFRSDWKREEEKRKEGNTGGVRGEREEKSPCIRGHVSGVIGSGKRRREKNEMIEE